MKNRDWRKLVSGSAEQVVAHGELQLKRRRNPSMSFLECRNPRLAFEMAKAVLDEPRAYAGMVDGRLKLVDPEALAMMRAVAKCNCCSVFQINFERIQYFKRRAVEQGLTADEAVIVILNVDDVHGSVIAEVLMPKYNWQEHRDRGEIPFARGLVGRDWIQEVIGIFDKEAKMKLSSMTEMAVVVVDQEVAEVFPV